MTTFNMLLSCPDQKGLVAEVSNFVAQIDGNILHGDQHHDHEDGIFFQRVEFELSSESDVQTIMSRFKPIAERYKMMVEVTPCERKMPTAILCSKQGHCLYDLLSRVQLGELNADIVAVISNHNVHADVVRGFGIDFFHLPVTNATKKKQEQEMCGILAERRVELVVMARYMQILTADFITRFENQIINIHHSFLPAFVGAKPYHQAHARGVKLIGATAHYATEELDGGPIIEQRVERVSHRDTVRDMIRKGSDLERLVLGRAVQAHVNRRVMVHGNRTIVLD